jgi:hypothetical protein
MMTKYDTFDHYHGREVTDVIMGDRHWIERLVTSMRHVENVDIVVSINAQNRTTYPLPFDHVKGRFDANLPINDSYTIGLSKLENLKVNILLTQVLEAVFNLVGDEKHATPETPWLSWSRYTGVLEDVFNSDDAPSTDMPEVVRLGLQGMDVETAVWRVNQIRASRLQNAEQS